MSSTEWRRLLLTLTAFLSLCFAVDCLTGTTCIHHRVEGYNQAYSYNERYSTGCGSFGWSRCTRYRSVTRYRYALRNVSYTDCCPGYENTGSGHCVGGPPVTQFTCSFDNGEVCGFIQSTTDDFDWDVGSQTQSSTTGPQNGDVTGNGQFAYIEASLPRTVGQSAVLTTPLIARDSAYSFTLKFYNLAYGQNMGNLEITMHDQLGYTTLLWSRPINGQGYDSTWKLVTKQFVAKDIFYVTVNATCGSSPSSDYSIDSFLVASTSDLTTTTAGTHGNNGYNGDINEAINEAINGDINGAFTLKLEIGLGVGVSLSIGIVITCIFVWKKCCIDSRQVGFSVDN